MLDFEHLSPGGQVRRLRRLAEEALRRYGIEPVSLAPLSHYFNTTFAVTGPEGSRYVLRIHRGDESPLDAPRRRTRLESELWWLDRLRTELDVPVPEVIRTSDGAELVEVVVDGVPQARLCVVFRWMGGRFLERGLRPRHLEQVGRLTARLHEHSTRLSVPAGFERQRVDRTDGEMEEYVGRLFSDASSEDAGAVTRAVFRRVRQVQEEVGSGSESFGLIHADIHQHNYLFNGGQVRLIDFDDSGWGHYLYDLAVTLLHVDFLAQGPALRAAYLRGYRQLRALTARQEAMIETFIMLRVLQDAAWSVQERETVSFGHKPVDIEERVAVLQRFLD